MIITYIFHRKHFYCYSLNPYDSTHACSIEIPQKVNNLDDEEGSYICANFQDYAKMESEIEHARAKFQLHEKGEEVKDILHNEHSFVCEVETRKFGILNNKYMNFELRTQFLSSCHSKKIVFYPKYIIVNQTSYDIELGKDKDVSKIIHSMDTIYYNPLEHKKVQFRTSNYGIILSIYRIYI